MKVCRDLCKGRKLRKKEGCDKLDTDSTSSRTEVKSLHVGRESEAICPGLQHTAFCHSSFFFRFPRNKNLAKSWMSPATINFHILQRLSHARWDLRKAVSQSDQRHPRESERIPTSREVTSTQCHRTQRQPCVPLRSVTRVSQHTVQHTVQRAPGELKQCLFSADVFKPLLHPLRANTFMCVLVTTNGV